MSTTTMASADDGGQPSVGVTPERLVKTRMSYVDTIANYIPSSIQNLASDYLPAKLMDFTSLKVPEDPSKDPVIWAKFQEVWIRRTCKTFLILAYTNGFQIWDVTANNVVEMCSKRMDGPVKFACVLPEPINSSDQTSPLASARPLVTITADDKQQGQVFTQCDVRLYSLQTHRYVHALRFRTEVLAVEANNKVLAVALKDQIYGFDVMTMANIFTYDCYPNPGDTAAMSLGARWLAFATKQPLKAAAPQIESSITDVAVDVASSVATGLYAVGDMGFQALRGYLNPEAAQQQAAAAQTVMEDSGAAGTVMVKDPVSQDTIAHFQADTSPIQLITFNKNGNIVVTCSITGRNINVFQIVPGEDEAMSHRHLYKLVRGVTPANIRDISISRDSKWIAISTSHCTSHVYAINPTGGNVTVHTHSSGGQNQSRILALRSRAEVLTQQSLNRVRQPPVITGATQNPATTTTSIAAVFSTASNGSPLLYVANPMGLLNQYTLDPHAPTQPDMDANMLQLDVEQSSCWDVCRRQQWPECMKKFEYLRQLPTGGRRGSAMPNTNGTSHSHADETADSAAAAAANASGGEAHSAEAVYLSNVELTTHDPNRAPIWEGPQFEFQRLRHSYSTDEGRVEAIDDGRVPFLCEDLTADPVEIANHGVVSSVSPIMPPTGTPALGVQPPKMTLSPTESSILAASPPVTENELRGNISRAMAMPMEWSDPSETEADDFAAGAGGATGKGWAARSGSGGKSTATTKGKASKANGGAQGVENLVLSAPIDEYFQSFSLEDDRTNNLEDEGVDVDTYCYHNDAKTTAANDNDDNGNDNGKAGAAGSSKAESVSTSSSSSSKKKSSKSKRSSSKAMTRAVTPPPAPDPVDLIMEEEGLFELDDTAAV
eukprot:GFYU01002673.1.p1 GENE.GFYU01002673.1~~GFYU01002673.1.p1  ORF type:complete len:889 (-),score=238.78 GFYU01002673.1:635-3301(-)